MRRTGEKSRLQTVWGIAQAAALLQCAAFAGEPQGPSPKTAPADLPNVLIIGDSISMGYTKGVQALLKDAAHVSRPSGNCAHSGSGVKNVQTWVGTTRWDVVHFNFGIWDTHWLHNGQLVQDLRKYRKEDLKRRFTTEEHVENLARIVAILKKTGAKLIWASTTPYVSYGEDTKLLVERNNQAAKTLMEREGVAVNDLHGLALPHLKEWQSGDGCHFNQSGYQELARQVAAAIAEALDKRNREVRPAEVRRQ